MSKSIDELVASLPESRYGNLCWAQSLESPAVEFLEAVKQREATGVKLHRGSIVMTLKREFDVTIGEEAVRKHIKGMCRCD